MEQMQIQQFFQGHLKEEALFNTLIDWIKQQYPNTKLRICKTQINLLDPHSYCILSLPYRRRAAFSHPYLIVTLGYPTRPESERFDQCVQISKNRWTCHLILDNESQLNQELLQLIKEARIFAKCDVKE